MGNITGEDILKLKMELLEEDRKIRHQVNNYQTNQDLLHQTQEHMQENIKEIKTDIKEGFKDIKDSFDKLPDHFATKDEHSANDKRISRMEKAFIWLMGLVGTAIVAAILKLVLI